MKHRIRGKRWDIKEVAGLRDYDGKRCDGLAYEDIRTIYIERRLTRKKKREVLMHEYLHAAMPDLSEPAITEASDGLEKLLRKKGYRP